MRLSPLRRVNVVGINVGTTSVLQGGGLGFTCIDFHLRAACGGANVKSISFIRYFVPVLIVRQSYLYS